LVHYIVNQQEQEQGCPRSAKEQTSLDTKRPEGPPRRAYEPMSTKRIAIRQFR
jgi:hypothetical protein